jgi:sec-independent protein translocase protein TatB
MLDFSFGELALIGAVALVVLGPERLPKVARTVGEWLGKAQRYVSQVKSDINREMELAELKKLQEEARGAAQSMQAAVQDLQSGVNTAVADLKSGIASGASSDTSSASTGSDYAWEGGGDTWNSHRFERRYKSGPSVDELAEEVARLRRQLAMPEAPASRHKYGRRARLNRPRIRR